MIGSLGVLSWLQSNVRRLMQKTTAPSYNPDTDSLEALRERLDALLDTQVPATPTAGSLRDILNKDTNRTFSRATDSLEALRDLLDSMSGSGFSSGTDALRFLRALLDSMAGSGFSSGSHSLKALRDKIDTLPTSFAVKSSASAATANGTIVEDGTSGTPNITSPANVGTSGSFSAWQQLDASVSADSWISHLVVTLFSSGTSWIAQCVVELGKGGAGAETTIMRCSFRTEKNSATGDSYPIIFPCSIPIKVASGTRLSIRAAQLDTTTISFSGAVGMYQNLET
ncbi:hypothetical protein LLH00_05950 [bacterium]|nr:hypothetical protein [bacterium]